MRCKTNTNLIQYYSHLHDLINYISSKLTYVIDQGLKTINLLFCCNFFFIFLIKKYLLNLGAIKKKLYEMKPTTI